MENKLPEGWEWKKLGEVFQLSSGKSRPELTSDIPDYDFIYPIYGGNGILGYSKEYLIDEPTIVIGRVGQYCGSVYISEQKSWISDNALYAKRLLTDRINLKYLKLALFNLDLNKFQKKCGQPLINQSIVCNQSIPLPPLEIQQKIVSILEKAEETKKFRAQADELTQKLLQSVFLEIFGDPMENPNNWNLSEFKNISKEFRYGSSNKSLNIGYPILRIPNVVDGEINLKDLKYCELLDKEYEKLRLLKEDMLFVRTNGNQDYVGRCAIIEEQQENFVYASYLIRAKIDSKFVLPQYLKAFFSTSHGKSLIKAKTKTSAGQFNINTEGLGSLPVLIPPIKLQQKFVELVNKIEETKKSQKQSSLEINTLFDALMQKAFTGELAS